MKLQIIISVTIIFSIIAGLWHWLFRKQRHQWYIRRAKKIYKQINENKTKYSNPQLLNYLRQINPYVFEELLLIAFEQKGYKVIHNFRYSGDGGIDGYVIIDRKKIPIQAKRYRSYIRREHVVAFAGVVQRKNVPFGYFVHTGKTGSVHGDPSYSTVHIISGQKLINLLDNTIRYQKAP